MLFLMLLSMLLLLLLLLPLHAAANGLHDTMAAPVPKACEQSKVSVAVVTVVALVLVMT
jgi:hypothetical protein